MRILFIIYILLHSVALAHAQNTPPDSLLKKFLDTSHSTCVIAAVIHNNKTETFSQGTISKENHTPVTENSLFEIGSLTKLFTATLTAYDVNKHIFSYTDSLSSLLPEKQTVPEFKGKELTILDILQHTSGLPRIPDNLAYKDSFAPDPYAQYSDDSLKNFLKRYHLTRPPGSLYEYSNTAYGLMGYILTIKNHSTYEKLIKKFICNPLQMQKTTVNVSAKDSHLLCKGYTEDGKVAPYWHFKSLSGAGSIHSNIHDLKLFLQYHLDILQGRSTASILSLAGKDCLTKTKIVNPKLSVGLGWHVVTLDHKKLYFHGGETYGFRSFIAFFEDGSEGVVILTNSAVMADNLGIKLLRFFDQQKTNSEKSN